MIQNIHQHVIEILLKVALNTIKQTNKTNGVVYQKARPIS